MDVMEPTSLWLAFTNDAAANDRLCLFFTHLPLMPFRLYGRRRPSPPAVKCCSLCKTTSQNTKRRFASLLRVTRAKQVRVADSKCWGRSAGKGKTRRLVWVISFNASLHSPTDVRARITALSANDCKPQPAAVISVLVV